MVLLQALHPSTPIRSFLHSTALLARSDYPPSPIPCSPRLRTLRPENICAPSTLLTILPGCIYCTHQLLYSYPLFIRFSSPIKENPSLLHRHDVVREVFHHLHVPFLFCFLFIFPMITISAFVFMFMFMLVLFVLVDSSLLLATSSRQTPPNTLPSPIRPPSRLTGSDIINPRHGC